MHRTMTIRRRVRFHNAGHCKILKEVPEPGCNSASIGRVPRITRLMASAIRLEELVRSGQVEDYAALADLGHVTRARISQIMNLTLLAPDIQEAILSMPPVQQGPDPITERELRPIAAEADWHRQRQMWSRPKRRPQHGDSA